MFSSAYLNAALLLASGSLTAAVPLRQSVRSDSGNSSYPVTLLYQYPVGTWVENIAVRPNGQLLLTHSTLGRVDTLNPLVSSPQPQIVFKFPNSTTAMGIGEISNDNFAVAVGSYDFATGGQPIQGSWQIWGGDFNGGSNASFTKLADVPQATNLDGLCTIPSTSQSPNNVLTGDIKTGAIWRVNTQDGSSEIVLNNNYTAPASSAIFGTAGVNGIHIVNNTLYFTNTGTGIFGKVAVDDSGAPTAGSAPEVIASVLNSTMYFDDFAIQGEDVYLVTGSGNSVEKLGLDGTSKGQIIAGSVNSTEIAEPASCAFGRTAQDSHILYVVTGGGLSAPINGNTTVGAQVLAIDTNSWDEFARM